MAKNNDIILVCGGSCSGKTTLAKGLCRALKKYGTSEVISMDNYYHDLSDWDPVEADNKNFDAPEAIDSSLLYKHLKMLQEGIKIPDREYDFKTHIITELGTYTEAADFIVVEGIFAMYFEDVRNLSSVKFFLQADADIRLARRVERDIKERRLPVDLVIRQYLNDVRPSEREFIEPYSKHADLVINSNESLPKDNLDTAINYLEKHLI